MAHFAKLDDNNIVQQVLVVDNENILNPETNEENESIGIDFCKSLLGEETNWKQTSYNGSFRKNFAGYGYTYDSSRDAFIPPKPYDSWILNEDDCQWYAPLPKPRTQTTPAGDTTSEPIFARCKWDEDKYNETGDGWVILDDLPIIEE